MKKGLNNVKERTTVTMGFRQAVRTWANKPSRREAREKERKAENQRLAANEESAQVRALKKQIGVLEDLLEKNYNQIKQLSDVIANHKQGDWMDRVIDKGLNIADSLFAPKPKTINMAESKKSPEPQEPTYEEGASPEALPPPYTDEQVEELVNQFSIEDIQKAAKAPYGLFNNILKKHHPNASQANILKAYTMVQEKAENGTKQ